MPPFNRKRERYDEERYVITNPGRCQVCRNLWSHVKRVPWRVRALPPSRIESRTAHDREATKVAKPRIDALSSFAGVATFVAGFALADLGQFEYYNPI